MTESTTLPTVAPLKGSARSKQLEDALARLIADKPFYGYLLSRFRRVYSPQMQAPMATTINQWGTPVLFYNPAQFFKFGDKAKEALQQGVTGTDLQAHLEPWTNKEITAVLEHECLHQINLHITRMKDYDKTVIGAFGLAKLANIACDMAINQYIENLPPGCVDYKAFGFEPNLASESYYQLLEEVAEKNKDKCPACGESHSDTDSSRGESQQNQQGEPGEPGQDDSCTCGDGEGNEADESNEGGSESGDGDQEGDSDGDADSGEGAGEGEGGQDGEGQGESSQGEGTEGGTGGQGGDSDAGEGQGGGRDPNCPQHGDQAGQGQGGQGQGEQGQGEGQSGTGSGTGSGKRAGQENDLNLPTPQGGRNEGGKQCGNCGYDGSLDDHTPWTDGKQMNPELAEEHIRRLVADAQRQSQMNGSKSQGYLPAGVQRMIEECLKQPYDWRPLLRRFCQGVIASGRKPTRMKPNRRFGYHYPGAKTQYSGTIAVLVDTSGSMGGEDLAQVETELRAMSRHIEIIVAECDAALHSVYKYKRNLPAEDRFKGGGGTMFESVFDYISGRKDIEEIATGDELDHDEARKLRKAEALFVLTDGYVHLPEHPGVDVLWGITPGGRPPYAPGDDEGYGDVVFIGDWDDIPEGYEP